MIQPTATINQRQLDAAIKRLERYRDRPLQQRAQRAYTAGAQLLAGRQRAMAPRGPTGNLRASIKARPNRLRAGREMAAATAGTRFRKAPHRHLVTAGTRPHALTGVRRQGRYAVFKDGNVRAFAGFSHPGSKANPFIAEALSRYGGQVQSFINDRVTDLGETFRVGG